MARSGHNPPDSRRYNQTWTPTIVLALGAVWFYTGAALLAALGITVFLVWLVSRIVDPPLPDVRRDQARAAGLRWEVGFVSALVILGLACVGAVTLIGHEAGYLIVVLLYLGIAYAFSGTTGR